MAKILISVDDLASGEYKLMVREFVGSAKAEQPLVIRGNWVCEFSR